MQTFWTGPKKLLVLGMLLAVIPAGCARMTGIVGTNASVCSVWKPIGWSTKDTDQTIVEVKVNNARREGWCQSSK